MNDKENTKVENIGLKKIKCCIRNIALIKKNTYEHNHALDSSFSSAKYTNKMKWKWKCLLKDFGQTNGLEIEINIDRTC